MNGSLSVDLKDFLAFRELFEGPPAGAAAVPEPSAGLLLMLAGLSLLRFPKKSV